MMRSRTASSGECVCLDTDSLYAKRLTWCVRATGSWRVIKNMVVLREWSLHETLAGNGVRLQFAGLCVFLVMSMRQDETY